MRSKILTMFKKKLSKTIKFIFGNYREYVLSKTICHEIEKLVKIKRKKIVKILDFNSNHNPGVINDWQ